jgi:protein gp37
MTAIPYLTRLWSPIEGCTPVSAGCAHCWARANLHRWGKPMDLTLHPERMDQPRRWRKPQTVGVGFTGDLFHEDVPDMYARAVLLQAVTAPRHRFIFLTKRPEKMHRLMVNLPSVAQADNVWLGVSVEDQATADERLRSLLTTPGIHRWISLEPQIAEVDLAEWLPQDCDGEEGDCEDCEDPVCEMSPIEWVVQGCESGSGRRPFDVAWARSVRDACNDAGVPYYLKQMPFHGNSLGIHPPGKVVAHPVLDGRRHLELPWKERP